MGAVDNLRHGRRAVVVVGAAKHGATLPRRWVLGEPHELLGLFRCLAHLEQHAHGAEVQQLGGVLMGGGTRSNERHDVEASTQGKLVFHLAVRESAVLHVVEDEVGTGTLQNLG